jgi:hypothetical protein
MIPVTFMHPPARHSSPVGQRLQVALGAAAALAAISLSQGSAQAFVVNVGGVQYDVTTFTGSHNNFNGSPNGNTSKFETAANGGSMPWWNSQSLAIDFSLAVGNNFGANLQYAYLANACGGGNPNICTVGVITWNGSTYGGTGVNASDSQTYAVATQILAPVPGPLPLFGAAAAFGFSRKLRKRIKLAPAALGSSRPQA